MDNSSTSGIGLQPNNHVQELKNAREFLTTLNSHLSRAVSLLLFIFLTSSVQGQLLRDAHVHVHDMYNVHVYILMYSSQGWAFKCLG